MHKTSDDKSLFFRDMGLSLRNLVKNYSSSSIMGRCAEREDETSAFKMCSWNTDVAVALISNLKYIGNLHNCLEVGIKLAVLHSLRV